MNGERNEALEALSPEAFEISAKKNSTIFKSGAYSGEYATTGRTAQANYDPEIVDKLREQKFNIQRTIISEYSNAKNRGTVFFNPKFSSCWAHYLETNLQQEKL